MTEVIHKLQELIDTEKEGQGKSDSVVSDLIAKFAATFDFLQKAIISTSADSDAQRIALAMRAEKLSKAEASRRELSDKEARQESSEKRKIKIKTKTGIDVTPLVDALTEVLKKEEKKGGMLGKLAKIGLKITSWALSIKFVLNQFGLSFTKTFKFIFKTLRKVLKPVTDAIKKTKAFKLIQDIFTRISNKVKPIIDAIKKTKAFKLISSVFSKIAGFSKGLKGAAGITKSGGIFKKFFGVLGRLGGVLGKIFAPLGVILGAFAGIFDAVKAFQGKDGNLAEKIIAGISGFFEGFIGFAIGGLLDLGKDLLVWILGIFGVPEEKLQGLKDFSFTDFLKDLVRNIFDAIVGYFKSMFNGAVDGFNNTEGNWADKILGGIMGLINGWFNGLLDGFAKIIDGIAGHFGGEGFSFKDWVLGFVGDIWNGITGFFKNIWEGYKKFVMKVIMTYVNIGKWIFGFVKGIWDKVVGVFKWIFDKWKKGVMMVIMGYVNLGKWIFGFVKGIWNSVTGFFKNIFEKGKKGAMALITKAINLGNWIVGFVKDIWNSVTGFFKSAIEKGKKTAMAGIMKAINLGNWIIGFVKDIWGKITDFFGSLIEKAKTGVAAIGDTMMNIGDALKGFIRNLLPERDSIGGKILGLTGIYEKVAGPDTPSAGTDTLVDESAIIPPNSNVGEALTQAGNMTNATSVTVVNNNGGNTTNTTTSSQTNNTSSASPPVLSGSAMAM